MSMLKSVFSIIFILNVCPVLPAKDFHSPRECMSGYDGITFV